MSEVPRIGGQPGIYEEKWSQWFLERSFFRDFVYRNPRGKKKGQELADAVVLFDDVALMVQIKAQCGRHDPLAWATEKLKEAFIQLCATHKSLAAGHIKNLRNDFYGEIEFDPKRYSNFIGLIILSHNSHPYAPANLAPEILTAEFPVHVFSLKDFATVASRFDTAGDFVTFLEFRHDIGAKAAFNVHDETGNIELMVPRIAGVLRAHRPSLSHELVEKTVHAFEEVATGELLGSVDWKYGLAIDDMIARSHDIDPELPWNKNGARGALEVARFLGWLTRNRRMKVGKKLISKCEAGRDGKLHYFSHVQRSRGTACVYLVSSENRPDRLKTLEYLVSCAHTRHRVQQSLGVATEPLGRGRSYDFLIRSDPLPDVLREKMKTWEDPFGSDVPL